MKKEIIIIALGLILLVSCAIADNSFIKFNLSKELPEGATILEANFTLHDPTLYTWGGDRIWTCNEWERNVTKYGRGNSEDVWTWRARRGCKIILTLLSEGTPEQDRPYLNITYVEE